MAYPETDSFLSKVLNIETKGKLFQECSMFVFSHSVSHLKQNFQLWAEGCFLSYVCV